MCLPTSPSRRNTSRMCCSRQAVVNAGITFQLPERDRRTASLMSTDFVYENGIQDYVAELAGEGALTAPVFWQAEKRGRDRADKPEYKVKLSVACCFSNKVQRHRALPQLLLAGARRRAGKGGEKRLCLRSRQVPAGIRTNIRKMRARSPGRILRTAWSSSPTTSPPRPVTRTRRKNPSPTSSCRRP